MPYSDRREAGDHCARVSHQDRGPEQDSGGHEQPEAEAPHGVPGGTEYTVQAEQYISESLRSLTKNELCERIAQGTHQKLAIRSGRSPKISE